MANPIQDSEGRFIAEDEAAAAVFRAAGLPFVMPEAQAPKEPIVLPKARPLSQQVEDARTPYFDDATVAPMFEELGTSASLSRDDRFTGRKSAHVSDYRDARAALNSLGVPLGAVASFEAAHAKAQRRGEQSNWTYAEWRAQENAARAAADPSGRTAKGRAAIQDITLDRVLSTG